MRKIIGLAVLLAVVALLLVTAVPALANGDDNGGPPEYSVQPTIGGPNNPHTHFPPGAPTVTIPADNPAIVEDQSAPLPGDVFWPNSQ